MTAPSVFVAALLLAVGSNAATAPSSQCAYLHYYFNEATNGLLPSLLPSINSKCLTEYVAGNQGTLCVPECQSLYSTYSQCASSHANTYTVQCGTFKTSYCPTSDNGQSTLIYERCNDSSNCSPSCVSAIASVEAESGCCSADILNGPKVLCGQQPIAPCPSVLNGGSVAAPSNECAYVGGYIESISERASLTPSLNSVCRAKLSRGTLFNGDTCIMECQSFYILFERCFGAPLANVYATYTCGMFNKQNCSSLYSAGDNLTSSLDTHCSNATFCSPECRSAITALELYGGCCYAEGLNGPKVLCGQQPIPYCSTIVNDGSAAISITANIFLMISTAVLSVSVTYANLHALLY